HANRAALIGDGAGDRLANPPRRVRAEFVAALVVELVDRAHEADVAFLDQVEQLEAAVDVLLRERNDEAEVRFDQLGLRAIGDAATARDRIERLRRALLRGGHLARNDAELLLDALDHAAVEPEPFELRDDLVARNLVLRFLGPFRLRRPRLGLLRLWPVELLQRPLEQAGDLEHRRLVEGIFV